MPVKDVDVLGEAIADTEQELFHGAFEDEAVHDDSGNRDLEQLDTDLDDGDEAGEAKVVAEGDKPADEAKAEGDEPADEATEEVVAEAEAEEPAVQEPQGRVPSARLREEAEKRKAVEAERDALRAESERVIQHYRMEAEINRRAADDLRRAQQTQQPSPTQEKDTEPDLFVDPSAHRQWMERRFEARVSDAVAGLQNRMIEQSFVNAHGRFGEEFLAGYGALRQYGNTSQEGRAKVQQIMAALDPGIELMRWHRSNEVMRRVGNDPDAYEKRVREEEREAALADPEFLKAAVARARAQANGTATGNVSQQPTPPPRTITRLPSLNGKPGGAATPRNVQTFDNSEQGLFESAWAD